MLDALSSMSEGDEPSCAAVAWSADTQDEWYLQWYKTVHDNPNDYPKWKIIGGQLYCYRPDEVLEVILGDEHAWKLVVPMEHREAVIKECHDSPTAGHPGREKTYAGVSKLYYWSGYYQAVKEYVKNCLVCQQSKVDQRPPTGLMGQRVLERPWQMVAGDITGPFIRSKMGFE